VIALAITPFWGALLLLFARMTGVAFSAPIFSDASIPTSARIGVALALTAAVAGFARAHVTVTLPDFLFRLLIELVLGLGMGFVANAMVYAAFTWGGLVDAATGLSLVSLLNPFSSQPSSLFQTFAGILALFVFAVTGGIDGLVVTLAASVRLVPVGLYSFPGQGLLGVTLSLASGIFGTGVLLALPTLAALAVVNFAVGLLARMLPQMNVFALSLGLGPLVAILFVTLGLSLAVTVLDRYEASSLVLLLQFLHAVR
jgi:flagellar biosynthetic protein FliR